MNPTSPDAFAPEASAAEPIVNISCYKFVLLENLASLRDSIRAEANRLSLRGTVLLSHEGINLFVAGPRPQLAQFVAFLRSDSRLKDLEPKESENTYQPFNRMLVKIKKEIIAFGINSVDPIQRTSPKLKAAQLKQWLDEGRKVHLLDVRNDYEYDLGTFDNAIKMGLDHFREFPEAVARLPEDMKHEPVVMFCTGGIRCEKAGPFMEQAGFEQIYQLDGGILKYFEEVGGNHYHGECFVFDQRVAVDPGLRETATTQCYICQAVVTAEDQKSPQYVPGISCPACYLSEQEKMELQLQHRELQMLRATTPLPGSQEYFNNRPLNIPERFDGFSLIDCLDSWHPQVGREEWLKRIQNCQIVPSQAHSRRLRRRKTVEVALPLDPARPVRAGERFDHLLPGTIEPDVSGAVEFLHEDDQLIVLNKPAPLPMHPSGRYCRNTLRHFLNVIYYPERPHMVHRLDANTTGVVLLCRRKSIARQIQPLFEQRQVSKWYLARVHGHPAEDSFACDAAIGRLPDEGGLRSVDDETGDAALTEFTVLRRLPDGTSLIEARPLTGRTNQIRAHLWQLGFPIVGDPAWLPDRQQGENRTLKIDEPPMCLHALRISLKVPERGIMTFEAQPPAWAL